MKYDIDKYIETVSNFNELLMNISSLVNIASEEINEADKAFGDIRHLCELDYPTDSKVRTKVCRLMHDYSKVRRSAKDAENVLTPLATYVANHKEIVNQLSKVLGEMRKAKAKSNSERHYSPRVLKELFGNDKE